MLSASAPSAIDRRTLLPKYTISSPEPSPYSPSSPANFLNSSEQALITGALSLLVQIEQDRFLQIEEEYDFREHELIVETYSYRGATPRYWIQKCEVATSSDRSENVTPHLGVAPLYLLLNQALEVVIRADSLPHHQRDYRKRRLQHFPHHLHDEKGRIRSFTGRVEDFVSEVITRLAHG